MHEAITECASDLEHLGILYRNSSELIWDLGGPDLLGRPVLSGRSELKS